MHKFFKLYLNSVILLGCIFTIFILMIYNVEYTLLGFIIAVSGILSEISMLRYTQNKGLSLQAAITILSILLFNPATCVIITILEFIAENIIIRIQKKEFIFNLNIKILFNCSMRVLCTIMAGVTVSLLMSINIFLAIFSSVLVYNLMNLWMVALIIYLYTNDKENLEVQNIREIIYYNYVTIGLNILLYYGYSAYNIWGVVIPLALLLPCQNALLGGAVAHEMENSIFIDNLTKAYNRASLNKLLKDYLSAEKVFTIIFLDFNRFKRINDTYGHDVGDRVLIHFADSIKQKLKKSIKLYRFGGDEFCIVLNEPTDIKPIIDQMENLKDKLVLDYNGEAIPYSFSIGFVKYNGEPNTTLEDVINKASRLMEEDKVEMHKIMDNVNC